MATQKQIAFLQKLWKNDINTIDFSKAKEIFGIDENQTEKHFGNFLLKKKNILGFSKKESSFIINLIDDNFDLDNNPIIKNTKFVKFIQDKVQQGITEIHETDLLKFNISHMAHDFQLGNILISRKSISSKFNLTIIDETRDFDRKLNDNSFDINDVIRAINEFKIKNCDYEKCNENHWNKLLETYLKKHFINAHQQAGKTKGIFDLVIGKDEVVVEIKLSKSLKSIGVYQRALGQIEMYLDLKGYDGVFLILLIGSKSQKQDKYVKELEGKIEKKKRCKFHYLQTT